MLQNCWFSVVSDVFPTPGFYFLGHAQRLRFCVRRKGIVKFNIIITSFGLFVRVVVAVMLSYLSSAFAVCLINALVVLCDLVGICWDLLVNLMPMENASLWLC